MRSDEYNWMNQWLRVGKSHGFREYESTKYELAKLNRTSTNETCAFREDGFNECELTELNRTDTKEASEFRKDELNEYELTKLT